MIISLYQVFEISVSELKRVQELLAKQASQPIHQVEQEEFDRYVLVVLHLINLLCVILKPDKKQVFRFKQTVHKLTKLNILSLRGKCL